MNIANDTRSSFEKYLPLLIGLLVVFLTGKAIKRAFWSVFAMYWAVHAIGMHF